jgi:hypothetical protein
MGKFINLAGIDFAGGGGSPTPPGPTPSVQEKDVNLYDYDGTLLYSYTAAEFSVLEALPDFPTHDGLTAQGWNWSLVDAKLYVSGHGILDIGMTYITSDGRTRIYITLQPNRTSPVLDLYVDGTLSVDWGDGSTSDILTGSSLNSKISTHHEYLTHGKYVITIIPSENARFSVKGHSIAFCTLLFDGNYTASGVKSYQNSIDKILFGSGLVELGDYALQGCYKLKAISIPEGITKIGANCFKNAQSLKHINIPHGVTLLDNGAFSYSFIERVILPNTIANIVYYAFQNCYSLKAAIVPDSVTNIGSYAYQNCYCIEKISISANMTQIDSYVFDYNKSVDKIVIPDNIQTVGVRALACCFEATEIIFGSGLKKLDSSSCFEMINITELNIPAGVTEMSYQALNGFYSLKVLRVNPVSPPVVQANTFYNLPSDAVIYVPAGSVDAYKAATNWLQYASQIQAMP